MSDDVVDRVAYALAKFAAGTTYSDEHVREIWLRPGNQTFREPARAVLAVLCEPKLTADALKWAVDSFYSMGYGPGELEALDKCEAALRMIAACAVDRGGR